MTSTQRTDAAKQVVELARDGCFTQIEDLFAPRLRAAVSAQTLRIAWASEIGKYGPVAQIGEPTAAAGESGLTRVSIPVTCERGGLTVVMSLDDSGRLHGLRLAPAAGAWEPPPYADRRAFAEHEVVVGTGPLAVPGALTLPKRPRLATLSRTRRRPQPAAVLLSGGGPFDRDETSGANKPLKDLAWGLAVRGVATLRFDAVTCTHPHVASTQDFMATREYLPHALDAVRILRQNPGVDPARIFLVGHSMGGKFAPRIAEAATGTETEGDPAIAGMVLLAADAEPMHHAAVRVARHLAALNPTPEIEAAVGATANQAARVDDPDLSAATPAEDLPFGYPASYWLDMRSYDPVATAAAGGIPALILQGARDYQVTVADDLARWRRGLAHRPNVDIRVYDADDHLFFPGEGPSTPAGYDAPQHVDPAVIADIAYWIHATSAHPKNP